jgi:hypothetical protein
VHKTNFKFFKIYEKKKENKMKPAISILISLVFIGGLMAAITAPIQHATTSAFSSYECVPCVAPLVGCCGSEATSTTTIASTTLAPTTVIPTTTPTP